MIRVYIAGPYTGDTEANVRAAILAKHALMDAGLAPWCPHLSHYSEAVRARPYEDWMALDLAWLPCAHAMFRLPGESKGADREERAALAEGIPVFRDMPSILEWARGRE